MPSTGWRQALKTGGLSKPLNRNSSIRESRSSSGEVLDGDFVTRDGSMSPYNVRPVDPYRLLKLAIRAMEEHRR